MNCPVCTDSRMREVEKDGVLIDICPSCKGVWLDRGELDKLMSEVREVREDYNQWYYDEKPKPYPPQSPSYDNRDRRYDSHNSHGGSYNNHGHHKHKKKKSVMDMFGDLFGD
ncbi:zf-TFIIB domain-containing protein [Cohnella thailandensis]|uniref:Zf-TFIIB domain-containing protein n=1 Tax=Cohnella thailandensis TaxID=557557 RepID=A0A841STJ5_9BACL|nr:zf-TFIIB domain-containing protein [Cohnella thailandensis]MBB6633230.1 zf-TFIIB domain-containing protein [Cohnella thailandensis]MBP1975074.1 Zn-finger nucleic acid-binding protein [Cohnella thailandensis]